MIEREKGAKREGRLLSLSLLYSNDFDRYVTMLDYQRYTCSGGRKERERGGVRGKRRRKRMTYTSWTRSKGIIARFIQMIAMIARKRRSMIAMIARKRRRRPWEGKGKDY